MDRRIVKLMRDPFIADLGKGGGWWFIEPTTGDILFGSAVLHAWRGLAFSLVPGSVSCGLWLQYSDSKFEIGSTDDPDADSWVEAVNAFLTTKRCAEPTRNGFHDADANLMTTNGVEHSR